MVIEPSKTFSTEFGEEYSNSNIGADELGNGLEIPGKAKRRVLGVACRRPGNGFDPPADGVGACRALPQEIEELVVGIGTLRLQKRFWPGRAVRMTGHLANGQAVKRANRGDDCVLCIQGQRLFYLAYKNNGDGRFIFPADGVCDPSEPAGLSTGRVKITTLPHPHCDLVIATAVWVAYTLDDT
jgi:hypothetical protein